MAHWAQLNDKNIVTQVIVTTNDGDEGEQWLADTFGGTWIKTSYNATIRGKFAGIGDLYDEKSDRFIDAAPYPSWKLNKDFVWNAPKKYPSDGKIYKWDELNLDWSVDETATE